MQNAQEHLNRRITRTYVFVRVREEGGGGIHQPHWGVQSGPSQPGRYPPPPECGPAIHGATLGTRDTVPKGLGWLDARLTLYIQPARALWDGIPSARGCRLDGRPAPAGLVGPRLDPGFGSSRSLRVLKLFCSKKLGRESPSRGRRTRGSWTEANDPLRHPRR